ncbi:MAG: NAD(P)/FAD-dependent oxidoreductase [Lachnospiraceae bacterium]
MSRTVIIGGGAAGMMAAIRAADTGKETIIIEKNEKLGKKLFITGKGRCNVTNACETSELFEHVMSNPKFLYSAFYGFDNTMTMAFFEEAGCKLKVERGDRVFPVSDHSSDVIRALENTLKKKGVHVLLNTTVTKLITIEEETVSRVTGVKLSDGRILEAENVVVATGGISYPLTGSTGDGYRFAKETGHKVTEQKPSLIPLVAEETFCAEMMGLSLKNVAISLACEGKILYSGFGEMLFTHFGVSGPLILSASCYYVQKAYRKRAVLTIDLKPALSEEQLDKRLLKEIEENRNKQFKNSLNALLPTKMIPVVIRMSGIDPEKKTGDITKEERKTLLRCLKEFTIHIIGCRGYEEAIITKGGVVVSQVNPSTMESKKVKNLYFAGEVLDLDAVTGGFNLQIAWSTGYLAGNSIVENGME